MGQRTFKVRPRDKSPHVVELNMPQKFQTAKSLTELLGEDKVVNLCIGQLRVDMQSMLRRKFGATEVSETKLPDGKVEKETVRLAEWTSGVSQSTLQNAVDNFTPGQGARRLSDEERIRRAMAQILGVKEDAVPDKAIAAALKAASL